MFDHSVDSIPFVELEQTAHGSYPQVPVSVLPSPTAHTADGMPVETLTLSPYSEGHSMEQPSVEEASTKAVAPVKRQQRQKTELQKSPREAAAMAHTGSQTTTEVSPTGKPPVGSVTNPSSGDGDVDPFSPQNLAIAQNFSEQTQTKRLLTTVRVGRPKKEAWVRTSADPDHWIIGTILELKDQGEETYWVTPNVRDDLIGEPCLKAVRLILTVDRSGNPFFWKIALPDPSGRSQPWVDSMVEAATVAKSKWVRVAWSMATRNNEVTVAGIQAEPKWPTETIGELLNIAFKGRIVSDLNHPVLLQLRGQE
jgi:hypothetical protein